MPRAEPGVIAREAQRRKLLWNYWVPVAAVDRNLRCSTSGRGAFLSPGVDQKNGFLFTLHLSGSWVERGCLGEVESLVGDCRPPPPGNPRRPTRRRLVTRSCGRLVTNLSDTGRFSAFIPGLQKNGGDFLPLSRLLSYNIYINLSNLKILIKIQNFKKTCSFFSCNTPLTMLRFVHSHCHLYGVPAMGSPPIVITNVLLIEDYKLCAARIVNMTNQE
jgi:hypothetical protein